MARPEWPYAAAREQILSDEGGGCSGASEVAGEARPSQRASPQANAERVRREADKGRAMTTLTMRLVKGDFIVWIGSAFRGGLPPSLVPVSL